MKRSSVLQQFQRELWRLGALAIGWPPPACFLAFRLQMNLKRQQQKQVEAIALILRKLSLCFPSTRLEMRKQQVRPQLKGKIMQ